MATMASATALVAAVNAAAAAASKPPSLPSDVMSGVLDYSALNGPSSVAAVAAAVSSTKSSKFGSGNGNAGFDMGRHPISTHTNNSLSGYGGRLQFFKGMRKQQKELAIF